MSEPERILVVGPSWIGDMVMAQEYGKQAAANRPLRAIILDDISADWDTNT